MTLSSRVHGGIVVLEPDGQLTIGRGDVELTRAVEEVLASEAPRILVNLGAVEVIDSSGIGSLIAAYNRARARGGDLKLLHLSAKVQDVLQIAHLHGVFEIFDDERTALESFGALSEPEPDSGR